MEQLIRITFYEVTEYYGRKRQETEVHDIEIPQYPSYCKGDIVFLHKIDHKDNFASEDKISVLTQYKVLKVHHSVTTYVKEKINKVVTKESHYIRLEVFLEEIK